MFVAVTSDELCFFCCLLLLVTTGLDAAVAFRIFAYLREFARIGNTSVVAALLQPSPELYQLFDSIVLIKDGHGTQHNIHKAHTPY